MYFVKTNYCRHTLSTHFLYLEGRLPREVPDCLSWTLSENKQLAEPNYTVLIQPVWLYQRNITVFFRLSVDGEKKNRQENSPKQDQRENYLGQSSKGLQELFLVRENLWLYQSEMKGTTWRTEKTDDQNGRSVQLLSFPVKEFAVCKRPWTKTQRMLYRSRENKTRKDKWVILISHAIYKCVLFFFFPL